MKILRWLFQWTRHWHKWWPQERNFGEWSPTCKCMRIMSYLDMYMAKHVCYTMNLKEKERRKEWIRTGNSVFNVKGELIASSLEAKTGIKMDGSKIELKPTKKFGDSRGLKSK
jgi:hypothetical protein